MVRYTVHPNAELIPPARRTPNSPVRSLSTETTSTLYELVTPPEAVVEASPKIPEPAFAPPQARKSKERNVLKKLLSGVRNKKRSYDSCPV
jgi:hypothetical protein